MTTLPRCPYIRLATDQGRVSPGADPSHRCYLGRPPQQIGGTFQEKTCLAPAFHICPRLVARPRGTAKLAPPSRPQWGELASIDIPPRSQPSPLPPPPSSTVQDLPTGLRAGRLQKLLPLGLMELLTLAMSIAFLLSCGFVAYSVFYRLRVGPGMLAPVAIARAEVTATTEALPTLMPTFTPTPSPTPPPTATRPLPIALPTVTSTPVPTPTPDPRPPADSPPTRLVITTIGVDIPVLSVGTKKIQDGGRSKLVWDDVPNAGAFHSNSAYPGNSGNTVINGHRDIQGSVFRRLDQLKVGDEILVYVEETPYAYSITETLVVPEAFATAEQRAQNQRLIGDLPEERLTLVTCTPVGLATHRLLVIAGPSDQAGPQMPEAGSEETP